jgi:hypothetical protein
MMRTFLFFSSFYVAIIFGNISTIYLSWSEDPTTTMTVQWHSSPGESDELRLQLPDGIVSYTAINHPFSDEPISIHTIRLKDLLPNTEYSFQIGNNAKKYTFRTAPLNLEKPLKFLIGGDLYLSPITFRKMCRVAMSQDPLFAVLGGDLAYAFNNPSLFAHKPAKQWRRFLADWTQSMQTPEGRLIPFLIAPGNHDITAKKNELFFALFDFSEKQLYRAIDFGSYLSLILLDTGHFSPIEGAQTAWLKSALSSRTHIPYLFAIYHVSAYPSFFPKNRKKPKQLRANWCPLFDEYALQAAFEHHNHTYKKTVPLKTNQKDPSGTIYFGDGCWGVKPRKPDNAWYLEKAAPTNHLYLVEMTRKSAWINAIGLNGELLDKAEIGAHPVVSQKEL